MAIERLKAFEPKEGEYRIAYSGGKDSDTVKILAKLADVKAEVVHNLTTVDMPETIYYIKSQPDVIIEHNYYKDGKPKTMWNLIVQKGMPPTRKTRYCCSELKESTGIGKIVVTGVRWAESPARREHADVVQFRDNNKKTLKLAEEMDLDYRVTRQGGLVLNDDNDMNRRMVELCYRTRKTLVNPIVDWTDQDVWDFLHHYGCESNPLYQCGFKRIGCVGCPLAGAKNQKKEFERYPKYKNAYIMAFDRMVKHRKEIGKESEAWQNGEEVMDWWLQEH